MPTEIRPITSDDKEGWLPLWSQYNTFYKRTIPDSTTSTTFDRLLDPKIRLYCAVAIDTDSPSSQVIGFTTYFPHLSTSTPEDIVYLQDLFVNPNVRNKGTGKQLIEYVYEKAKTELNAGSVYWHTQHFNHAAQLLYVKVAGKTDFVHYEKVL